MLNWWAVPLRNKLYYSYTATWAKLLRISWTLSSFFMTPLTTKNKEYKEVSQKITRTVMDCHSSKSLETHCIIFIIILKLFLSWFVKKDFRTLCMYAYGLGKLNLSGTILITSLKRRTFHVKKWLLQR